MSEFVEVEWFGREDTIGFVLTYDQFDGFKVRCGLAGGVEAEADTRWLMQRGGKIPFEWAWGIFGRRMKTEWRNKHLELVDLVTVRYDRRDYNIDTLEEVVDHE